MVALTPIQSPARIAARPPAGGSSLSRIPTVNQSPMKARASAPERFTPVSETVACVTRPRPSTCPGETVTTSIGTWFGAEKASRTESATAMMVASTPREVEFSMSSATTAESTP